MSQDKQPLCIGGMGGSGTRLFALIMAELGYHLGHDLNDASDNLFFTLLFRRKNIFLESASVITYSFDLLINSLRDDIELTLEDSKFIRSLGNGYRHDLTEAWLKDRIGFVLEKPVRSRRALIAWKEPNSHVLLQKMLLHNTQIKYLNVTRDGLDMAISKNQQQLMLWGDCYLNRPVSRKPADALHYWNAMHKKILELKAQYPERIEFISYDSICKHDPVEIQKLYDFAGISPSKLQQERISELIRPPKTLGRAQNMRMDHFETGSVKEYQRIMQAIHDC